VPEDFRDDLDLDLRGASRVKRRPGDMRSRSTSPTYW
jgi:hypothetical protein